MGARSWSMESRSRMVTARSSSVSRSTEAKQVEVSAVGDALQLAPAPREPELDVRGAGAVVAELAQLVFAQAQALGLDAEITVPGIPLVDPGAVGIGRLGGRHEILELHLLELARAVEEVAG